ncbi:MAG: aminoacetone oxidase family FAD-binding enzyme [Clostridiales bacterium]|nr:aminoacetone oxidase family FAD-binding enzyme [Clostridiales bacterium]
MEIIIVGAGASALACGITALKSGAKVTLLDKKDSPGRKILATGNGRCNLTNTFLESDCYNSTDLELLEETIDKYKTKEIMDFFNKLGLMLTDVSGYIYPNSKQSKTVVDVLFRTFQKYGGDFIPYCEVNDIYLNEDNTFSVKTSITEYSIVKLKNREKLVPNNTYTKSFNCDKVVVATGSRAGTKDEENIGYTIARKFGHKINPTVPALVPLYCHSESNREFFVDCKGVRANGKIDLYSIYGDVRELICSDKGEIQFTENGLSGIVTFQVSASANRLLLDKKCERVEIELDLLDSLREEEILKFLISDRQLLEKTTFRQLICGIINSSIAGTVCKEVIKEYGGFISEYNNYQSAIANIIHLLKHYIIVVDGSGDFENAQVCSGGILTEEIKNSFESKIVKNLYFIGEVLDVDGKCGGYNLHFAWASGIISGENAGKSEDTDD